MLIDRQLTEAGWSVQDKNEPVWYKAGQGIAVREVTPAWSRAMDYPLYVDRSVVGATKPSPRVRLSPASSGSPASTPDGLPGDVRLAAPTTEGRLPFVFEASGTETHFTNGYDPEPRARRLFNFPSSAPRWRAIVKLGTRHT